MSSGEDYLSIKVLPRKKITDKGLQILKVTSIVKYVTLALMLVFMLSIPKLFPETSYEHFMGTGNRQTNYFLALFTIVSTLFSMVKSHLKRFGVLTALLVISLTLDQDVSPYLLVLVIVIAACSLVGDWAKVNMTDSYADPEILQHRVFGEAGIGLTEKDTMAKFGENAVSLGIEGEIKTGDAIEKMLEQFPYAQLVHGLVFPGSENADMDHAVVYGNKVALIDSKNWKGNGTYSWYGDAISRTGVTGGSMDIKEIHFPEAVHRMKVLLGNQIDVAGWVLIHNRSKTPIVADNSRAMGKPRIGSEQIVISEIADWFREGPALDEQKLALLQSDTIKAVLEHKQ